MKSNLAGIGIIVIATLLTTAAQVSFKLGSSTISFNITSFINPYIILGFISYALAAILLILALRLGDLSVMYPIWSLSFVWITLISLFFLGESVNILNWVGIGFVIAGVSFIGFGARND